MEINAKCRFDYESVKALTHVTVYKKKNPQKAFIVRNICSAILVLLILVGMCLGVDTTPIVLLMVAAVIIALNCFLHFGIARIQFKALHKMKNLENEYTFYEDVLKVSSKAEEYNGEAELKYSLIPKVMETSKYLFVFQNNNQVLIVDKSTIINGTINDIREKLIQFVKDKYIICKY